MVTVSLTDQPRSRVPELTTSAVAALGIAGLVATLSVGTAAALDGHTFEDAGTAVVWAVLAGLLWRRVSHPTTPMLVAVATCAAVAAAGGGYAALGLPGATTAAWLSGWVWAVSTFVPVTLLPATFPSGRWGDHPRLVAASIGAVALVAVGLATSERIDTSPGTTVDNPIGLPFADGLFLAGSVLVLASAVWATAALCARIAHLDGEQRRQYVPVVAAVVVTLPTLLVAGLVGAWSPVLQLAVAPLVPGALTLSILQHRLYDVEVVVRRSIVFAGLTVLVIGGYVLVVQAMANLLHRTPGTPESVVAAGAVALAFAPARSGLQRLVGRWVYGDRDDPVRALSDVNELLTAAADPTRAVQLATERLKNALRVTWVRVDADDGYCAEVGVRPRWLNDQLVTTVQLVHLGVEQGTLSLAPRGPADPLDARDRSLAAPLASMVASVLASRRLVADLQRSREDVVLGREEERRRLRRDLHDGVGPLLSALSSHADVALLRADRDPSGVVELVRKIRVICDQAVADLRLVVEDLQPAAVDELGLAGALAELTATMTTDAVAVQLTCGELPVLPAAVEVAAFRIVAEAVNNSLRHAHATGVDVRVTRAADALTVCVADDGHGVPQDARRGVGLVSMHRRAEELGGSLRIETSNRGTTVRVALPVRG
jgi:signal transduction histidine kinase